MHIKIALISFVLIVLTLQVESQDAQQANQQLARRAEELKNKIMSLFVQGSHFLDSNQPLEALKVFQEAAALAPRVSNCWYNMGIAWKAAENIEEAIKYFERAASLEPNDVSPILSLCVNLMNIGKSTEALQACSRGLTLHPTESRLYLETSRIFRSSGDTLSWFRLLLTAVRLNHTNANALSALGAFYFENVMYNEAIVSHVLALLYAPMHEMALTGTLLAAQRSCRWDIADAIRPRLQEIMRQGKLDNVPAYHCFEMNLEPHELLLISRHVAAKTMLKMPLMSYRAIQPLPRLKIGYICANGFQERTTTARFIHAIIAAHDAHRFEIWCWSLMGDDRSITRMQIAASCHHFIEAEALPHMTIASGINEAAVAVLIDVVGLSKSSNIYILSVQPCPHQMHFHGYPGTLASPFIHYFVGDKISNPPEYSHHFQEKLLYHPLVYLANSHAATLPFETKFDDPRKVHAETYRALASAVNTTSKPLIFASFNQQYKLTKELFETWLSLLRDFPTSILWMLRFDEASPNVLWNVMKKRGFDASRLVITPLMPKEYEFFTKGTADIVLDCVFVGGHTTTVDALWVGLPVVTLPQTTMASRIAASLVIADGCEECVARDLDDYHRIAVVLAKKSRKRSMIRKRLLPNKRQLTRFWDWKKWTLDFEKGVRMIFETTQDKHIIIK